jgi:hypothetical protein
MDSRMSWCSRSLPISQILPLTAYDRGWVSWSHVNINASIFWRGHESCILTYGLDYRLFMGYSPFLDPFFIYIWLSLRFL